MLEALQVEEDLGYEANKQNNNAIYQARKRGYTEDEYTGIWRTPNGKDKIVWFLATKREGLSFDSKSWGPEITACKERWKNRKKGGTR